MNALNTIKDVIGQLTSLLVATVGLGVVAGIVLGGDTWFVGGVLDSLLDVVVSLMLYFSILSFFIKFFATWPKPKQKIFISFILTNFFYN